MPIVDINPYTFDSTFDTTISTEIRMNLPHIQTHHCVEKWYKDRKARGDDKSDPPLSSDVVQPLRHILPSLSSYILRWYDGSETLVHWK